MVLVVRHKCQIILTFRQFHRICKVGNQPRTNLEQFSLVLDKGCREKIPALASKVFKVEFISNWCLRHFNFPGTRRFGLQNFQTMFWNKSQ